MPSIMVQGTSSGAGKTVLVTALCWILRNRGYSVAPFKAQNMSNYSYRWDGLEIASAQAMQAVACGIPVTTNMNPILLKPRGNYESLVYLNGKEFKKLDAEDYYEGFARSEALGIAMEAFHNLQHDHDVVVLEGAGSPAEINLREYDVANMRIAKSTNSPVLLVTDIERGGSFASLLGTLELLEPQYRKLVRGMIINKFRGSRHVLKPGLDIISKRTKKPVLGVIPMIQHTLPDEDSLDYKGLTFQWSDPGVAHLQREIKKVAKIVEKSLDVEEVIRLLK